MSPVFLQGGPLPQKAENTHSCDSKLYVANVENNSHARLALPEGANGAECYSLVV
jgi:hypothetical protein